MTPQDRALLQRAWPVSLFVVVVVALRPSIVSAALILGLALVAFASNRVGAAFSIRRAAIVALVILVISFAIPVTGVGWDRWGGLMLTLFLASAGILLSFPFGVALALGRRSSLPVVRIICTGYIELIRGVPLITLLFMGSFVIGLLFPPGTTKPSLVTRAVMAIVMFTAAYIAEIVRGGLQSVPRAQSEAALALGLTPRAMMRLVVLPQALRAVIPSLVGQFISLFKDTSLVAILGLTELLRVSLVITSQGRFLAQGLQAEALVFASFMYWVFSYTMSKESQRLERRLGVGER